MKMSSCKLIDSIILSLIKMKKNPVCLSMFIYEHWKDVEGICWLSMGMELKVGKISNYFSVYFYTV